MQVQKTLKRLAEASEKVNKQFMRETNNRVLRPQELPRAITTEEQRKKQLLISKQTGVPPLDCPVGRNLYRHRAGVLPAF